MCGGEAGLPIDFSEETTPFFIHYFVCVELDGNIEEANRGGVALQRVAKDARPNQSVSTVTCQAAH